MGKVGSKRPLDEDVFSSFNGGFNDLVVSVNTDIAYDQINVRIFGKLSWVAVSLGASRKTELLPGSFGGCLARVAECSHFIVRGCKEIWEMCAVICTIRT